MYWAEEASVEAAEEMGLRAKIGLVLLDILPMGAKENIERHWKSFKNRKFKAVSFSVAAHSIYTVSKENLIWAKNFAKKNRLPLHIHLSETEKEIKDCLRKYKMRPAEYLDRIGFLNKDCILAHSIWLSEKEIKILAKRKCNVVYCPCSNMKLASGVFPYGKLKSEGVSVALGTDGAASDNNLDLFEEMKFGSLLQKINKMEPTAAPASEIFEAATKNGAGALKINAGEIKEGKLADLILVDLSQVCLTPGHNLLSDLVYSCSGNCVSDVIVNGKILMRDRTVKGEEEIIKQAVKRIKKLAGSVCGEGTAPI